MFVFLVVAALAFLVLAGSLLVETYRAIRGSDPFASKVATSISDVLLAVILVELVETIRQQLGRSQQSGLGKGLAVDLLIIGLVAGIRHVLAVSAQLTLLPTPLSPTLSPTTLAADLAERRSLMLELGLSAVLVVLVAVGLALTRFWEDPSDP